MAGNSKLLDKRTTVENQADVSGGEAASSQTTATLNAVVTDPSAIATTVPSRRVRRSAFGLPLGRYGRVRKSNVRVTRLARIVGLLITSAARRMSLRAAGSKNPPV